ncbi:hypothetical protein A3C52_05030 [Candidatus Peribacteria bacterium RIFCSPHIGHO2_02_FULL_51_15]|nr:MAG: hypothetical protein A3C52_05030 [Candidatus Peribacteria bacterium RIFCSPHIGHO2_02_FULL_51_15]
MHVRSSSVTGLPIIDDETLETVGHLMHPLIQPDTGRIEGFFVIPSIALSDARELFLPAVDIIGWGSGVHIKTRDRLAPPEELIRLQPLIRDNRKILGQRIRIKGSKKSLGICADVQFDTRHFCIEWLFPRKYFVQRQPMPATDIVEVTGSAIWVKDPFAPLQEEKEAKSETGIVIPEVMPAAQN